MQLLASVKFFGRNLGARALGRRLHVIQIQVKFNYGFGVEIASADGAVGPRYAVEAAENKETASVMLSRTERDSDALHAEDMTTRYRTRRFTVRSKSFNANITTRAGTNREHSWRRIR